MQTHAPPRSYTAAFAYMAGGLAVILCFFFTVPADQQNLVFDAIALSSVAAIVIGTRRNRPEDPLAWYLMAAGQFLFVAGDVAWTIYDTAGVKSPSVSFADALYLSAYAPLTAGLLLIVQARRPGSGFTRFIDAAIITVAATVASWIFVIAPQAAQTGASEADRKSVV